MKMNTYTTLRQTSSLVFILEVIQRERGSGGHVHGGESRVYSVLSLSLNEWIMKVCVIYDLICWQWI